MTRKAHSGNRKTATIRGYVINDKYLNPYRFSDIDRAVLCAARCNALGQLDSISLDLGDGGTIGISLQDTLDYWEHRLTPEYVSSRPVEMDFRDHFARRYPLFIV